jgi:hypothetical protein
MLLHITQIHTPQTCTKNEGGLKALYKNVKGVKLLAIYGAFCEHITYYIVEAENLESVYDFLEPGWLRCTSKITPVVQRSIE